MKKIKDIGGEYRVINDGTVVRIVKPSVKENGYLTIGFRVKGKTKRKYVHRIVAEAFLENPTNAPEVNHKDGVKTNNSVENLEWVTRSENMTHSYRLGLRNHKPPRRGKHYKAKLILDVFSGIYYDCWLDAAEARGIDWWTISNARKYNRNNTGLISV